jgi:hypothetical protein
MDLRRRFALGKIAVFETLVRQFQGDIYVWTVRMVSDSVTAEDLTVGRIAHSPRTHRFRPNVQLRCLDTRDRYELGARRSRAQPVETESPREGCRIASS